ncbi:MAG: ABC transporter permease subunit, partial [Pseudomonadota bacterium]
FQVSDVAVISAVTVFALVPLTRYTIEGLRSVPDAMIEAADMSGATRGQTLWHVRLPMALPTIMVGVNQAVLFALFMVIIAAFIGTQDLGQEMQRALSASDFGKGLVLGLCVAFMGLMVDHLAMRWAEGRKRALGLA